jgi:prepilin-type N-terminal cleavage/methylation domain-containing protein
MIRNERAFTLVELIVVVVILGMIASLLLAALGDVLGSSRRVSCLNTVRQLGEASQFFASDHDQRVPTQIGEAGMSAGHARGIGADGRVYEATIIGRVAKIRDNSVPSAGLSAQDGGTILTPLGTLLIKGYIASPHLLWCPAYAKPGSAFLGNAPALAYRWDEPDRSCGHDPALDEHDGGGEISAWECWTNDDGWIPAGGSDWNGLDVDAGQAAGYTHLLDTGHGVSGDDNWRQTAAHNPTMSRYRENWRSNENVSPFLYACAQNMPHDYSGAPATTDLRGTNDGELEYPYNTAHGAEGANAVAFDGSARWIAREELVAQGLANPRIFDETDDAVLKWMQGYMFNAVSMDDNRSNTPGKATANQNSRSNFVEYMQRYVDLEP